MSRSSAILAYQRYLTTSADSKKPIHVSNRPMNRSQSACKNIHNLTPLFMMTSRIVIRFKSGAAQTSRLLICNENFEYFFVWVALVFNHLDVSIPLNPSCQHSCWRASFLAFCLGGRPTIYTLYIPYISFIYSMYIQVCLDNSDWLGVAKVSELERIPSYKGPSYRDKPVFNYLHIWRAARYVKNPPANNYGCHD